MPKNQATVTLLAGGVDAVEAAGTLWQFTVMDRFRRAGGILLIALVLAASLLPIPIIHLIGPPLIILTGLVVALRQLRAMGRLAPMTMPCPKCGESNRLGGGLGVRHPLETSTRTCQSCRRVLTMKVQVFAG